MSPDRAVLVGLLASGAIWIAGMYLVFGNIGPVGVVAATYVLFAGMALSLAGRRMVMVALATWASAVALLGSLVFMTDSGLLGAFYVGTVVGTVLYGLWIATGWMLKQFVKSG